MMNRYRLELYQILHYQDDLSHLLFRLEGMLNTKDVVMPDEKLAHEWHKKYRELRREIKSTLLSIHERGYWFDVDVSNYAYLLIRQHG